MARSTPQPARGRTKLLHVTLTYKGASRSYLLRPWLFGSVLGLFAVFMAGYFAAAAFLIYRDDILESALARQAELEHAYEDRIASLRRQVDAINSRQFLDQVAFENKLDAVRRRQESLEERQAQMAGLLEAVGSRDVTFALPPTDDAGKQAEREAAASSRRTAWTPLLVGRPRPVGQTGTVTSRDNAQSPAARSIAEIENSLDRLWTTQDKVLHSFESGLSRTIEQLAAVPQAIGAPLPSFDDGASGIGGPFVELRGNEPVAIADQIARIERAMDRVEALERHIRRLPVRAPLKGNPRMTSRFGSRIDPFLGRRAMHTGVDFRANTGTPVIATAAGRVARAGRAGGYGNLVEIEHGGGYATRYAHLSRIDVRRGQTVAPGDVIGAAGSTGRSTGPHLHYETRVRGRAVDPAPFVKAAELLPDGF
jgi:murein DD-endopeptidase MepM/ murein hydrolase activator NlpD